MGLVIVGVHSPEFPFEKKYENVLRAVEKFGIEYPVVLDNDFQTWQNYGNSYWPRKYLIDIDGFIIYDKIGEGGYIETESRIQAALRERSDVLGLNLSIPSDISIPAEGVDYGSIRSPEIYFGAWRNEHLDGIRFKEGVQDFEDPIEIDKNVLYLVGEWNISEYHAGNLGPARIVFRYDSKDVYMVASSESGVSISASVDGKPAESEDLIGGKTVVGEERLYKIVQGSEYGEHTLEIAIEEHGLNAFTFTFG